jgi:flagellar L-ring protein precursor FlgH
MKKLLVLAAAVALSGCASTEDAIRNGGKPPAFAPIENPQMLTGRRQVVMPTPQTQPDDFAANSLWRSGARTFFQDARAAGVGDILTVEVAIADNAQVRNQTNASRSGTREAGISGLLGFEQRLDRVLPDTVDPANLVGFESSRSTQGQGQITRQDSVNMTVAAVITQILPNGNFVLAGRQEVRVNGELRELTVSGIVRPQDITSQNTIRHTQLAEARISYGGRGLITQQQQPPSGQRVLDVLLPF